MRITVEVPDSASRGQHGVYVLLGSDAEPLYIGRTRDLAQRLRVHRSQLDCWVEVRGLEWTPCADGVEARQTERRMIETFTPAANQNDRNPLRPGRKVLPDSAADVLHRLHAAACSVGYQETAENHTLRAYIKALRTAGWTLACIGVVLDCSGEYVRLMALADSSLAAEVPAAPPLPPRPVKERRPHRWELAPHLAVETVEWMRTLQADARRCNGGTPVDSPLREASVRLAEVMAEEVMRGVSINEIARAIGVTHYAVSSRLARHGYHKAAPSAKYPRYLGRPAPHITNGPSDRCRRDHDLTGDNLRITAPGGLRVCRACERIRVAAYYERKAATA